MRTSNISVLLASLLLAHCASGATRYGISADAPAEQLALLMFEPTLKVFEANGESVDLGGEVLVGPGTHKFHMHFDGARHRSVQPKVAELKVDAGDYYVICGGHTGQRQTLGIRLHTWGPYPLKSSKSEYAALKDKRAPLVKADTVFWLYVRELCYKEQRARTGKDPANQPLESGQSELQADMFRP